jgi:hypothetical protein
LVPISAVLDFCGSRFRLLMLAVAVVWKAKLPPGGCAPVA